MCLHHFDGLQEGNEKYNAGQRVLLIAIENGWDYDTCIISGL